MIISGEDLKRIWATWQPYGVQHEAQEKTTILILVVVGKIIQMISLIRHSDVNLSLELLNQCKDTVTNSFLMCYYIGYELASGKMSRADGTPYLLVATKPIEDLVLLIYGILVAKEIIPNNESHKMSIDLAKLIGDTSNDICVLGIDYFRKIGYR
jgi:hypothetical protein